jgi:formylglycine-generating enzyme required for sulfatase activity
VGTAVDLIVPDDRIGLFVRRAGQGAGRLAVTNVQAVWNIASANVAKMSLIQMRAQALEMVYVAEGAFKVGSGGNEPGSLTDGSWTSGATIPYRIASEDELTIANTPGCLWGTISGSARGTIGTAGTLPAAFPKGYAAFYCMKDEASQGQYADFLNTLTAVQATSRFSTSAWTRYTLSVSSGVHSASVPDRTCNGLCYADAAAFMDWAGLRPFTELEFEKACRGPLDPAPREFAWGTTVIGRTTGILNDSDGTATAADGNCNCKVGGVASNPQGPFRVGIYATATSSREQAGASYWGILGLSGNLWEYAVSVDAPAGRAFTGRHGDGKLTIDGYADVSGWPSATDAVGIGFRGGSYHDAENCVRVSDRSWCGGYWDAKRTAFCSCRGVRTAPQWVEP